MLSSDKNGEIGSDADRTVSTQCHSRYHHFHFAFLFQFYFFRWKLIGFACKINWINGCFYFVLTFCPFVTAKTFVINNKQQRADEKRREKQKGFNGLQKYKLAREKKITF